MHGRVAVASFATRPLAELARGFLDEHDVDAVVSSDDANGTQPEVGFVTGGARVMVAPHDEDRARDLLAEVEATRTVGGLVGPSRHGPRRRVVAAVVAGTMLALGVWTTVVVLFL